MCLNILRGNEKTKFKKSDRIMKRGNTYSILYGLVVILFKKL